MKVMFAYRADVDLQGGAARMMEHTAAALRSLGADAETTFDPRPDPDGVDAVVAVNVWQPQTALEQLRHLRATGVPIVWLPIYLRYDEWSWANRAVREIYGPARPAEEQASLVRALAAGEYEVSVDGRTLTARGRNEVYRGFFGDLQAMTELVDHICVFSHREMQMLAQDAGLVSKPYTLIPHGVDAQAFASAEPHAFRQSSGIEGDFVLCVGAVDGRKNQLLLAEALRETGLPLVLVGPAFERDYLDLCLRVGGPRLRWIDRVDQPLVASAYKAASAHALPSLAEGSAMASLEAAAAGTPVVVSNRSSEFEYYGDLGIFCEPLDPLSIRDAVLAAVEARSTQRELGLRLAKRMSTHTWERAARAILAACERAAGATAAGSVVLREKTSASSAAMPLVNVLPR
jgi:glycosyltransferase involved in cell wall biosynthesis